MQFQVELLLEALNKQFRVAELLLLLEELLLDFADLSLELRDLFLLLALHDANVFTLNFIDEFRTNLLFQAIHEHLVLSISLFRLDVDLSILVIDRFDLSRLNLPLARRRILVANLVKRF